MKSEKVNEAIAIFVMAVIITAVIFLAAMCDPAYSQKVTQRIDLKPGWQMISSYVIPDDPGIDSIFKGLPVEIVVSIGGLYWPEFNVDLIGKWNPIQAYKVKMSGYATLNITGQLCDSICINYQTGLNYIPITINRDLPVDKFIAGHESDIIMIVDTQSTDIYCPELLFNTLDMLKPGNGYIMINLNDFTICQHNL